ncbi:MAG TPA: sulfate ABC transporter permease subunit CysT [Roseiarcus sp.]
MTFAATAGFLPFRRRSAIPGLRLTLAVTALYLLLIVVVPLAALLIRASSLGLMGIAGIAMQPRVAAALRVSFGVSLLAAFLSALVGAPIAWALARYRFPARRLFDAAIDLPFALPTAVAAIALSTVYAPNGWFGAPLAALGVKVAFTRLGILVAMIFVGFPFVVRTLQPVIAELETELEEASMTLGASRLATLRRVIAPPLIPAVLTGMALAFARGVGEYGSVIFIAGNLIGVTEIAPLLIVEKLEEFDYAGATAIAAIMLTISFVMLLAINRLQAYARTRLGDV